MASTYELLPRPGSAHQDELDTSERPDEDDVDILHGQKTKSVTQVQARQDVKTRAWSGGGKRALKSYASASYRHLIATAPDRWLLECLSLSFSIVLFIVLFLLFAIASGKPTSWWTSYLSFATIIAILSKGIQVTLMLPAASSISQLGWVHFHKPHPLIHFQRFDAASRGLLGTLRLLIANPSVITMLCLLLSIVALSIEAAAQQCLRTTPSQYIPTLLTIWTLDRFMTKGDRVSTGMLDAGVAALTFEYWTDDENMPPLSRVRAGVPNTLAFTCTDVNCIGPDPYVTLSLCTICEDWSDKLVVSPTGCDANLTDTPNDCYVNLPGGNSLQVAEEGMRVLSQSITTTVEEFQGGPVILANYSIIEQISSNGPYKEPMRYAAQSCTVMLCANLYQLDIMPQTNIGTGTTELLLASVLHAERSNSTPYVGKYGDEASYRDGDWPGYLITVSQNDTANNDGRGWPKDPVTLGLDGPSTDFLRAYLGIMFNGSAGLANANDTYDQQRSLRLTTGLVGQTGGTTFWEGILSTAIDYVFISQEDAFKQISGVSNAVTTSMANWLRDLYPTQQSGTATTSGLPGGYYDAQPSSFHVRWVWLAFPAVAEVSAIVLLCTAMFLTDQNKVPLWKSSTVAMMYHGTPRPDAKLNTDFVKVTAMEGSAQNRRIVLVHQQEDHQMMDY